MGLQVECLGVDEWLMLCIKFKELSDRFPDTWTPPDEDEEEQDPTGEASAAAEEEAEGLAAWQNRQSQAKRKKSGKRRQSRRGRGGAQQEESEADEEEPDEGFAGDDEWEIEEVVTVRIADYAQRVGKKGMGHASSSFCWM